MSTPPTYAGVTGFGQILPKTVACVAVLGVRLLRPMLPTAVVLATVLAGGRHRAGRRSPPCWPAVATPLAAV